MANQSYNIKDVYEAIYTINNYFGEKKQHGITIQNTEKIIHNYCHYGNTSGNCSDYYQKASSGVIHLLKNLKKYGLEYDKLAEYAILWLSYKLNIKPNNNITNLNEFYTRYIANNKSYNEKINGDDTMTYKDIIDKKKDLMNNKEISKFDSPFSILCLFYNKIKNNKVDCINYSSYPKTLASKFEQLNKDFSITGNISYKKLLSTLSDDYNNLKNKYDSKNSCNFPPIPQLTPQKIAAQNTVEIPVKNSEQIIGQTLEVTSSSSSITSKLIPGLSTFSVIPVFLGIAYKYSLFGVDKLFQRQYLRKKLKKITKKMKLNI